MNRFIFFKRIWLKLSEKRKVQFYILLLLTIVSSFFEAFGIGLIIPFLSILDDPVIVYEKYDLKEIYLFLNITEPNQIAKPITILFILISVISGIFRLSLIWFQTKLSFSIGADFSSSIYKRTIYQPYSVHIARNSSSIVSGITGKANAIVSSAIMPSLVILSSSLIIISILTALLTINFIVTLSALLVFGVIYWAIFFFVKNELRIYSMSISKLSDQVIRLILEGLGGIRDILINGSQEEYLKKFNESDRPFRKAQANLKIITNSPRYIVETIGIVLIALFAYSATGNSQLNQVIPIIGSFALGAERLLPAFQQIFSSLTSMKGGIDSISDALDLLEQPITNNDFGTNKLNFANSIVFKDVTFKYDSNSIVLKGIDLKINKGERIAFIGETGSGKSTLLDLLMGLLAPTSGEIYIDDVKLNESNLRSWQEKIAHVPQTIFLSDSTIMENIAFGVPESKIDFSKILRAVEKSQLKSTIETWDLKYQTLVGERGINLSGGQRQRIGIARALYRQAELIILDEATSSLDYETEASVMESIAYLDKDITVIIVAHRLSTIESCDSIYSLTSGRLRKISS